MSKFAGFIIGAIEIGIGIATGNVALIVSGGAMILSQAIVDLTEPKQPAREASEMTIAMGEQPRAMLVGETFTPGSLVDGFDYGGKYGTDWEVLVIRLADHKCQSLTGFFVNDDYHLYQGDGSVAGYKGQLELYFRPDTSTDPLPAIVTAHGPGWTAADIGRSGCDVIIAYKADKQNAKKPVWPGGRPRFGFVVKGKLCYDPRKDATVPGGAGVHRWTDPSTWEWSENAVICRYNWVRGVFAEDDVSDPTQLLVGRGLTADEAPPENIFAAANLCDEVQGTVWPYQDLTTAQVPGSSLAFSPDGTTLAYASSFDSIEWWNVRTRSKLGSSGAAGTMTSLVPNLSLAADGTAWFAGPVLPTVDVYLYSCAPAEAPVGVLTNAAAWQLQCTRAVGGRVLTAYQTNAGYLDGTVHVAIVDCARDFCVDDAGDPWMLTQPTGASSSFTLTNLNTAATVTFTGAARSGPTAANVCYSTFYGHFIVICDGHYFTLSKVPALLATGAVGWVGGANLPEENPGRTSFWSGFSQYSLQDGSLIRTVSSMSWVAASYSEDGFDAINDAIWARTSGSGSTTLRVLFLDRHGGYRVAGPIYANQEFIDVEQMFVAATAGDLVTREGSVELEPGQAKSVVATITDDDLVVGSKVSWNRGFLSQADGGWLNTVVANYIEPDQNWNAHDAPVVRNTGDIVADGKAREATLTQRLVRYQAQALRLAEIARRKGRLWGRGAITLGPRFCELEDGDWIQWTSSRFGGAAKTFRIEAYLLDEKWQNTPTLVEMSAEAFAADGAFSFDLAVPTRTVSPPDVGTPTVGNWALAAIALASTGASIPALEVSGSANDDDYVQSIIVEYWKSDGVTDPTVAPDSIAWLSAGAFTPDTTKVDITSVFGGATYYAAVSYVVEGIPGDRLVLGPVTVGEISTGPRRADTTLITADDSIHTGDLS